MQLCTESPEVDNVLVQPRSWGDEAGIHEQLRWFRAEFPRRYLGPTGFEPFWNLVRYHDIKEVEQRADIFRNAPNSVLTAEMVGAVVRHLSGRETLIRSLVQMDDPEHRKYRALTQSWFMGHNLRRLTATIDDLAARYVGRLAEFGGECDFIGDVAKWFPLRVIMSILGVPEEDEAMMLKLTQELFGSSDPDIQRSFEIADFVNVTKDFEDYFNRLTESRRAHPTDDVASVIANARIDGEPAPEHETNGYYIIIATAGHDTTSATIGGGLLALLQYPEQMARLAANPDALMPGAVDEMIRWVTPVRHFMRRAADDYTLGDVQIKKGQALVLWYVSANRDESVFEAPFEFRMDRSEKHLAFGFGTHVCLGQHLARMEISALFRELLRRVKKVELAGEPRYIQSSFVGGLKSLPIRYEMK